MIFFLSKLSSNGIARVIRRSVSDLVCMLVLLLVKHFLSRKLAKELI